MSSIFDKYNKKYDAWYDRNKFAYLSELEAIKRVLPEKGYGVEIGVGSGRFAAPLGTRGRKSSKAARSIRVQGLFIFSDHI